MHRLGDQVQLLLQYHTELLFDLDLLVEQLVLELPAQRICGQEIMDALGQAARPLLGAE